MINKILVIAIDVFAKNATRITQVTEKPARIKYSLRNDRAVAAAWSFTAVWIAESEVILSDVL